MNDLTGAVTEASAEIQQVRDWLLRPSADTICACVPALERAVACLEESAGQQPAGSPPATLCTAAVRLQQQIQQTQLLLATAGALYLKAIANRVSVLQPEGSSDQPAGPLLVIG